LVESASCLIVILNSELNVEYFNPFAEMATGFDLDALRRQHHRIMLLLGHSEAETRQRVEGVLAGEGHLAYEDQIQSSTGELRWITWTLSRIDDFDEGPAVLAVGHDVTDAKRAAEQLLQASRLATIGEMYAGLAHESRNALQRLRNCTDLLSDEVEDRPTAQSLVDRARRAQDDLQRLLDEVRSYAAPMVLDRTECRIAALCREAWNLLQVQRQHRRAELADADCDPAITISADRFRLVQAFRNILENALAACGDPVVIRVHCQEVDRDGGPAVEITFDDNGPGFGSTAIQRAFEPFFTTKSAGTGLGLAIVRQIVEAHGGCVSASRGDRGGARVCLTMPKHGAR
jgi:two-component system sensor kinase FixL